MIKNEAILVSIYMIEDYKNGVHFLDKTVERVISGLRLLDKELEALQQPKSCESCKHWKVRNKLVRSNECFKWSGSVMTPRGFCCNRYEAKEQ